MVAFRPLDTSVIVPYSGSCSWRDQRHTRLPVATNAKPTAASVWVPPVRGKVSARWEAFP